MDDRELLELAAKAAGIKIDYVYSDQHQPTSLPHGYLVVVNASGGHSFWNALADDGDALRLAVRLNMSVEISEYEDSTYAYAGPQPRVYGYEIWRDDKDAATRRAIVRAAAEIGKAM